MTAYNNYKIPQKPIVNRLSGFSLFELMLSVAIMSALMIAVVGYAAQQARVTKTERAANDITLLLQAGQSYYATNNRNPITIKNLENSHYLVSGQVTQNPWRGDYEFVYSPGAYFFGVKTTIPTAIAGSITAKLPATVLSTDRAGKTEITSYVGINPLKQPIYNMSNNDSNYGAIRDATIIEGRQSIPVTLQKIKCAANQIPRVFVLPAVIANKENKPITDVAAYASQASANTWSIFQKVNSTQSQSQGDSKSLVFAKCDAIQKTLNTNDDELTIVF